MQNATEALNAYKYPTIIIALGVLASILLFQIALKYDVKQKNQNFQDIAAHMYRTVDSKIQRHKEQIYTIAHFGKYATTDDLDDLLKNTSFTRIALYDPARPDIDNIVLYPDLVNVLKDTKNDFFTAPPYITPDNIAIMPIIALIHGGKGRYIIGYLNLTEILQKEFSPHSNEFHIQVHALQNQNKTLVYRQTTNPDAPAYLPEVTSTSNMVLKRSRPFKNHTIEISIYNPSHDVGALPWLTLLSALAVTTMLGYITMRITTENIKIRRTVLRQTQNLRDHARQLESANQDLDDFIHIASHDLKEPLRGIRNYADILIDDPSDLQTTLKTMQSLSMRMDGLISALMEYSVIARESMTMQSVHIADIAREAAHPYEHNPSIQITIQPDMPTVICHRMRMRQVFENLISNAIRFNDNDIKIIEIGCTKHHPDYKYTPVFYVRDNGIGIDKDNKTTVFKIFRRLNHPEKYGRTLGAGLTQTARIIHRHHGDIWIEPNDNGGTIIYFTLERSQTT